MAIIGKLTKNGTSVYPQTTTDAVIDSEGNTLTSILQNNSESNPSSNLVNVIEVSLAGTGLRAISAVLTDLDITEQFKPLINTIQINTNGWNSGYANSYSSVNFDIKPFVIILKNTIQVLHGETISDTAVISHTIHLANMSLCDDHGKVYRFEYYENGTTKYVYLHLIFSTQDAVEYTKDTLSRIILSTNSNHEEIESSVEGETNQ